MRGVQSKRLKPPSGSVSLAVDIDFVFSQRVVLACLGFSRLEPDRRPLVSPATAIRTIYSLVKINFCCSQCQIDLTKLWNCALVPTL